MNYFVCFAAVNYKIILKTWLAWINITVSTTCRVRFKWYIWWKQFWNLKKEEQFTKLTFMVILSTPETGGADTINFKAPSLSNMFKNKKNIDLICSRALLVIHRFVAVSEFIVQEIWLKRRICTFHQLINFHIFDVIWFPSLE